MWVALTEVYGALMHNKEYIYEYLTPHNVMLQIYANKTNSESWLFS